MKKKAWDMASVREWEDVSREAKRREGSRWKDVLRKEVNCLPMTPCGSFKGRTVFQGNNVRDENSDTALFQERLLMPMVTLLEMSVSRPTANRPIPKRR